MVDAPTASEAGEETEGSRAKAHVEVEAVTRVYPAVAGNPPVHALGPVSLTLRQGEFLSVVGPSGCGKSTLLDVIAGLAAPSEGSVRFEGQARSEEHTSELQSRGHLVCRLLLEKK